MGEGRRPKIVLTPAENLLQNFISSARRRWGWGRARRMDVVGETGTCMVMNAAATKAACALPSPASRGPHTLTLSTPLFLAPSNSGGGEGCGRWGQGQGIKVKTGNSGLAVPPTHHGDQETSWKAHSTARSWHGCSSHCTEEETEVQDRARSRVTQPAHNTRQGCGQKLGGPARSPHFFSLPLPRSSQALPSHFWLCDQVGTCGATGGGTGSPSQVHPPDTLRQPGCVRVHAHKAQPGWEQGTGLVPVRFPGHT